MHSIKTYILYPLLLLFLPLALNASDEKKHASEEQQPSPIPTNLRNQLPHPLTPWRLNKNLFQKLQQSTDQGGYKKITITNADPEWNFVHSYFNASPPSNLAIKKIHCIHNGPMTSQFESAIPTMEQESSGAVFQPKWNKETQPTLRRKAIERWIKLTKAFSPFSIPFQGNRQREYYGTKLLPMWHGTSGEVCNSICGAGFTYFGKHEGSKGSTDIGFFGSGIYFSNSAKYSAEIYGDGGNLLLAWVTMREPYPVVSDGTPYPGEPADMLLLKGKPAYENYNAHFIPVTSVRPQDPHCAIYYPCAKDQRAAWDELVVFQKSQCFAQYWIELTTDLPKSPKPSNEITHQQLIDKISPILDMMESGIIPSHPQLQNILEDKEVSLIKSHPQTPLDALNIEFCNNLTLLLDDSGTVRTRILKRLVNDKTPPPANSTAKPSFPSSPPSQGLSPKAPLEIKEPLKASLTNPYIKLSQKGKDDKLLNLSFESDPSPIQQLLEAKANIEARENSVGATPLFIAAQEGQTAALGLLLQAKANIETRNRTGATPLYIAAQQGQTETLNLLLGAKANIEAVNKDGWNPLYIAAQNGQTATIELLLRAKANIEAALNDGRTPLYIAAKQGQTATIELLLRAKANIEAAHNDGGTPLYSAAQKGQTEVLKLLLWAKANIEAGNKNGSTPLYIAAQKGQTEVLKLLLWAKANIEAGNKNGSTPLYIAAQNGHAEALKLLLGAKANIEAVDKDGWNPLYIAAQNGHAEALKLLLGAKANIEAVDKDGWNPLLVAAQDGHAAALKLLLGAKANTEARENIVGATPLYIAAENGQTEVLKLLLGAKANIGARNNNKCTPLRIATHNNHNAIVTFLKAHGATG